ncbi:MAG: hypothetical protein ABSB97_04325 [Thermoplasmata archaeon]|jgi:hypothetical protein
MESPPADTAVPRSFAVAMFVAAIVVGAVIAYLGITGRIGTGIP